MNTFLKTIVAGLTVAAFSQSVFANDLTEIKEALKKKYPSTSFTSVNSTPIEGVYEVVMGKNIAFTNKNGRYVIFGRMMDLETQQDLTADRLTELNKVDFDALPLTKAIKITSGNGKRAFAVFTDPDCPFCKSFERESLKNITDYTMYVFPFPIASLHPNARRRAINILCAKDKSSAWKNQMVNGVEAELNDCNSSVDEFAQIGKTLGINGTPTLIRFDGLKTAGALPAARLDAWLSGK